MSTIPCAVCGAQIEASARVCGVCAAPNTAAPVVQTRGLARLSSPETGGSSVLKVAGGLALAAFLLFAVVLPMLRASGRSEAAAPRVTVREVESGAASVLVQLQRAQDRFRAQTGRYAPHVANLGAVGVYPPTSPFYDFTVAHAAEGELCIHAVRTSKGRSEGVTLLSVDERGVVYKALGCTGEVMPFAAPAAEF